MRILTTLLAGVGALCASFAARADTFTKPNIVVVVLDDVGAEKVSAYAGDYPTYAPLYEPDTQAIDRLATRGVRFTRAWATPECSPTRTSLQTGQYPFRTGIGAALPEDAPGFDPTGWTTLAGSFASRGYVTGLFGKEHTGTTDAGGNTGFPGVGPLSFAPHPVRMGWQRYFGNLDGFLGEPGAGYGYYFWERINWLANGTGDADIEDHTVDRVHATDLTIDKALTWINNRKAPWFAMVTLNAAHSGTSASSVWNAGDVSTAAGSYRTAALSCLANPATCANERLQSYQALVEHADIAIERLLDGIVDIDHTIVVVIGDNGTPHPVQESAFATPSRGKATVYENGVHVPMIIAEGVAWRTGAAGTRIPVINRRVDARTHTLDLFQTLYGQAFMANLAGLDSVDLSPCLTTNDAFCGWTDKRYGYSEMFSSNATSVGGKMTVSFGYDTLVARYQGGCLVEELYDTLTDPMQLTPLSWTGIRRQRLRDHFTTLHTGVVSWANPTGAAVIGFCP